MQYIQLLGVFEAGRVTWLVGNAVLRKRTEILNISLSLVDVNISSLNRFKCSHEIAQTVFIWKWG